MIVVERREALRAAKAHYVVDGTLASLCGRSRMAWKSRFVDSGKPMCRTCKAYHESPNREAIALAVQAVWEQAS